MSCEHVCYSLEQERSVRPTAILKPQVSSGTVDIVEGTTDQPQEPMSVTRMIRIPSVNVVTLNSLLTSSCTILMMMMMMSSMVMVVDDVLVEAWGYAPLPSRYNHHHHPHPSFVAVSTTTTTQCHGMHPQNSDDNNHHYFNNHNHSSDHQRRRLLQQCTTLGVVMVSTLSQPALAVTNNNNNRLFQSNTLLTNPILEQLRIWEQEEADHIKYHGELERGDAGNQGKIDGYPSLLIPILTIAQDISYLYQLLSNTTNTQTTKDDLSRSYRTALHLLSSNRTTYDTIPFKRIFNAYADNVYYSDPDRANMYLGGGGTSIIFVGLVFFVCLCVVVVVYKFSHTTLYVCNDVSTIYLSSYTKINTKFSLSVTERNFGQSR
jgi:hypothetical protein